MERLLAKEGLLVQDQTLEILDNYWELAKKNKK
jgi:hypothetical protein